MKISTLLIVALILVAGASAQVITMSNPSVNRGTLTKADKLTEAEMSKLKELRSQLQKAQQALDGAEREIRQAHGDQQCPDARYLVICTGGTDVILDGDFALVYRWTKSADYGITW